jgi:hypothetical protein
MKFKTGLFTFLQILLLVSTLIMGRHAGAVVWENKQEWNEANEAKYSEWVQSSWTPQIFTRGRYQGIPTDCAKAAYIMHAIFAYENGLPFEVNDPTIHDPAARITNQKAAFDSVPEEGDKRFRKFVAYLEGVLSTYSVADDTYSPEVDRNDLRPGSIFFMYRYHTFEIQDLSRTGIPRLLNSTLPFKLRDLEVSNGFPIFKWEKTGYPNGGVRSWRNPAQLKSSMQTLIDQGVWSNTQYNLRKTLVGSAWSDEMHRRLSVGATETVEEKAERTFRDAFVYAQGRVRNVNDAIAYQQKIGGRRMNEAEDESYSTPGRDKVLFDKIHEFIGAQEKYRAKDPTQPTAEELLMKPANSIEWKPGHTLTLLTIYQRLAPDSAQKLSSDPNDTLEKRWGEVQ